MTFVFLQIPVDVLLCQFQGSEHWQVEAIAAFEGRTQDRRPWLVYTIAVIDPIAGAVAASVPAGNNPDLLRKLFADKRVLAKEDVTIDKDGNYQVTARN